MGIQEVYGSLVTDERRNDLIFNDLLLALEEGRSPILLTERTEHLDDSRLDTMFLALPISWRGTLQQYAGRLHRAHAGKRIVQIYDYVDEQVPVMGRMYRKRLRGYRAMGYVVTDTGAQESKGAGTHHA